MNSIDDGAKKLLTDVSAVLSDFKDLSYMVIGGWCPVLRNKTDLRHPGTLDVDILFEKADKEKEVAAVIEALIESGFDPSAKHPFQLLKKQTINGTNFIYNVDLLHPYMTNDPRAAGLFVDHLELDVPLNNEERQLKKMCSIVLPNSMVLFRNKMFTYEELDGVKIPLVSFDGMFVTKMDSCQKQKRERDSFDIYLAFLNGGINVGLLKQLGEQEVRIAHSLDGFKRFLKNKADEFNGNVKKFAPKLEGSPAKYILEALKAS